MKSPPKKYREEIRAQMAKRLAKQNPSLSEAEKNLAAMWPDNPDTDAHNDKIATMLELTIRNQELKERVRKLEKKNKHLLIAVGCGWAMLDAIQASPGAYGREAILEAMDEMDALKGE